MSPTFSLPDAESLGDLRTYLGRAARVEDGSVRLIAGSGVLAVYTAVLYPVGLLDEVPTVLGLRTFGLAAPATFDAVVPIRSFLERLDRLADRIATEADDRTDADDTTDTTDTTDADDADDAPEPDATSSGADASTADASTADARPAITVELPLEVHTVTWTAISPPRGGWSPLPDLDLTALRDQAKVGIAEVAETVPTAAGDAVVRRVRAEVWGRPIERAEHVPAGAAFAAESLGFLADGDRVQLFEAGPWARLTSSRGHVLVKGRTRAGR